MIWIRSGWLRGSIYWVLLVLGSVCGYKTIIPEAQEHRSTFLPLQDADRIEFARMTSQHGYGRLAKNSPCGGPQSAWPHFTYHKRLPRRGKLEHWTVRHLPYAQRNGFITSTLSYDCPSFRSSE